MRKVLEPISKLIFYSFCVIPGQTRNPATLPFIYKNKDLGIIDLKALTSLDAGFHRHD